MEVEYMHLATCNTTVSLLSLTCSEHIANWTKTIDVVLEFIKRPKSLSTHYVHGNKSGILL